MNQSTKTVCIFGIALLLNTASYAGNKLIVANDGVDSPTCGTANNPCRSISKAIENAGVGDTIIVGPGLYDESIETGFLTDNALVSVTKSVSIFSRDGADVTVLNSGTNFFVSCVVILASDSVFGAKGKGFTLLGTGFADDGVAIESANRVTVAGNRAIGITYDGFATTIDTELNQFIGNVAVACGHNGFNISGTNYTIEGNVAAGNKLSGFGWDGQGLSFTHNVASGNLEGGFTGSGSTNVNSGTITGNSFVGNKDSGIDINGLFSVTKNDIFGNDPVDNCGLYNQGATASALMNFWGAVTGPGTDPADGVCGSNTVTTPFATKEIKVKTISP